MPGGDATGPAGAGPRTGRRAGYCSGYNAPGFMNTGFGRGRGFGPGFRRGFGRCFGRGFGRCFGWGFQQAEPFYPAYPEQGSPQPTKEQEKQMLEQEANNIEEEEKALKQEKEELNKRLRELEKDSSKKQK